MSNQWSLASGQQLSVGVEAREFARSAEVLRHFAAVELYVHNWRWAGVPFYIRTGKRLARHLSETRVHLKRTPQALFASTPHEQLGPNVITLRIQPNEGISIAFDTKRPGRQMRAFTVDANFSYESVFGSKGPVAYERLLLDSMRGDATFFTRRDEVDAEWRIITPIEEAWANLPAPSFPNYTAGTNRPIEAAKLIGGDHRAWHGLIEAPFPNSTTSGRAPRS